MPRTTITPQELLGVAQTTGLVLTLTAVDTVNNHDMIMTGREILGFYNPSGTPYTCTIDGIVDPFGATRSLTAKALPAGAIKIFGPFDPAAWMQPNRRLNFAASNAAVRIFALRLPSTPVDAGGVLDAGGVIAAALTRTIIVPQRLGGSLATDGVTLLLTAADVTLNNKLAVTGREILFALNSDTGGHNVVINTVADDHGRTGDITHSLGAGVLAAYGNFDYAWMQADRYVNFQAADATVKFGAIRY